MLNKFILLIMRKLAEFSLTWIYNYIDENKDGLLSKREINKFTKKIKFIVSKGGK